VPVQPGLDHAEKMPRGKGLKHVLTRRSRE
jgi:hypothetical protein